MKRLLVAAIAAIVASTLSLAVRADVTQPEGEMPSCEVPGITVPRDRAASSEPVAGVGAAGRARPTC
jgi:hypothetical protein